MPLDLSVFHKASTENKTGNFTSLSGSSKALLFMIIEKPCLIVCSSEALAQEFYLDALFWSKALGEEMPVLISPKEDSKHFKSLIDIYKNGKKKCISSIDTALSPSWQSDKFKQIKISKTSEEGREFLLGELKGIGYHQAPLVSSEGEFSIRGGIVDVFPAGEELPIRIEFFGDEIESIRSFDIDTQRSVNDIDEASIISIIEPAEGPPLLDILSDKLIILNEPDDIKRKHPDLSEGLKSRQTASFTSLPLEKEGFELSIKGVSGFGLLREERKTIDDFIKRVGELRKDYFILIVSSSEGQAKRLNELFSNSDISAPVFPPERAVKYTSSPTITVGGLSRGFVYGDAVVLTEKEVFGERTALKPIGKSHISRLLSSIEDFKEGDFIVHIQHGIGRFLGIRRQKAGEQETDFIAIEYLGGDRLYVPLDRINQVQKYNAPNGITPKIDRLGGKTWQRTKQKVKEKVKDMAEKLLKLYAKRTTAKGFAFSLDTELHREFDGFFLYEETPDQLTAVEEIKRDMENITPMDRLLCGDVGYGKTEVAIRAAFKAFYDSKQVAMLAPTTILAEQHYNTFLSRFAAFPAKIALLSRFQSAKEQKEIVKALSAGDIDIVIGTHRLLAKDVSFNDLGLLIIDEEHKFGVSHKEKMKALKTNVDVLTLSATPIPRTLHMALSGIRAMSAIETPPEERLAVKSIVARFSPELIKDALTKEIDRKGQVFFVHNRIEDIYKIASSLQGLCPHAKIEVAHGQMSEKILEKVMMLFMTGELDILVSTAIIGAGLDIPNANTIIINRADKFGLADLYQLKGRVGRSNVKAYAYFLIPGEDLITPEARKRLEAIQELSYLGAGFRLALKDLEIRGAGNLLGAEQSGHIEAVGFDLYIEMLEEAVRELKGEEITPEIEPLLELKVPAMISEQYVEDANVRLGLYRRISSAKTTKQLRDFSDELKDRFGEPPEEALRLIDVMELKLMAKKLLITKIQNIAGVIKVVFSPQTKVTPQMLFALYDKKKRHIKYLPDGFEMDLRGKQWEEIWGGLKMGIEKLFGEA